IEVVEFADGSSIRLMENSRLDYVPVERQSPINRRAVLEGNALFDITPQQLGFIVETPSASATVMGTLFGVVATEEQTDVTLVEGRVALTGADRPDAAIVLEPGQQSTVRRGAMPSTPQDVDVVAELAWTELFIFRSEPLTDIARQLADHFGVRIDVDPSLTGELITGTFDRGESVEAILRTLAAAVDARLEIRSGGFLLAP
ncbi:MAG: FecR family protein, partial [Bacteroidota bacterium]